MARVPPPRPRRLVARIAKAACSPPSHSHRPANSIDRMVMGTPALAWSRKVSRTPCSLARSATIRLARLPTRNRLPASVDRMASPTSVPCGMPCQTFRIITTAGTLPIVLLRNSAIGSRKATRSGSRPCEASCSHGLFRQSGAGEGVVHHEQRREQDQQRQVDLVEQLPGRQHAADDQAGGDQQRRHLARQRRGEQHQQHDERDRRRCRPARGRRRPLAAARRRWARPGLRARSRRCSRS